MPKKTVTAEQAQRRLEDLCARAEHCTGELRAKLRLWAIPAEEADKIIKSLQANKFVDDARFAGAFVRDKVKFSRWGKRKIKMALMAKGVEGDIITDAIDSLDRDTYRDALTSLLSAKTRLRPELLADYEGRTRLFRFALQRGFETPIITEVIKSLL